MRPKFLDRTIEAISQLISKNKNLEISVKIVRRFKGVDSSDRSAVNFYSRALAFLEREGVLRIINHSSPKKYAVIDEKKLKSLVEVKFQSK